MKILCSLLITVSVGVATLLTSTPADAAYSMSFGTPSSSSAGSCEEMVDLQCDCVCMPGTSVGVTDCYYFDNGTGCQACAGTPCPTTFTGVWSGGGFLL